MNYTVPVLVSAIIVLLVVACGCTGDPSTAGFVNQSNGTPGTQITATIVPTGTGAKGTLQTTLAVVPTVSDDICVFGSKNCHLYEQCTNNCLGNGVSPADCAKVCCNVKCDDLPTMDEKVACSKVCLAKLSEPTPTLAPLDTPETLIPLGPQTPIPW